MKPKFLCRNRMVYCPRKLYCQGCRTKVGQLELTQILLCRDCIQKLITINHKLEPWEIPGKGI